MLSLSRSQILTIFVGGTALGLSSALITRVVASHQLAIPEDAGWSPDQATIVDAAAPATSEAPVKARKRKPSKRSFIDPILRRNIFDSTKVGRSASAGDDGDAGAKTSLPVVLLATVVAWPAESSSALIAEEKGEGGAAGYGIGDTLMGEATVFRIEQKRVILKRDDGSLEYLEMEDAPVRVASTTTRKAKWGGVEGDGVNKFTVDEDTFNKALENPEKLAQQIRAVPHTDASGRVDGYRLSGIRRSSLFNKLGIRNGDIVHSVNGNELTSMNSAMGAYESLQNERNFNFEITRRNKKQTFEYEVR